MALQDSSATTGVPFLKEKIKAHYDLCSSYYYSLWRVSLLLSINGLLTVRVQGRTYPPRLLPISHRHQRSRPGSPRRAPSQPIGLGTRIARSRCGLRPGRDISVPWAREELRRYRDHNQWGASAYGAKTVWRRRRSRRSLP